MPREWLLSLFVTNITKPHGTQRGMKKISSHEPIPINQLELQGMVYTENPRAIIRTDQDGSH